MKAKYISPKLKVRIIQIPQMMSDSITKGTGYRPDVVQTKSSESILLYYGWDEDYETDDASTNR